MKREIFKNEKRLTFNVNIKTFSYYIDEGPIYKLVSNIYSNNIALFSPIENKSNYTLGNSINNNSNNWLLLRDGNPGNGLWPKNNIKNKTITFGEYFDGTSTKSNVTFNGIAYTSSDVLTSGTGVGTYIQVVNITCNELNYYSFLELQHIKDLPLKEIQFKSDNLMQYTTPLTIYNVSIFKKIIYENFTPISYIDKNQKNTTVAEIKTNYILTKNDAMLLNILPQTNNISISLIIKQ